MRILLIHNRYQIAGGEDSVVDAERRLLESHSNVVSYLEENNDSIASGLQQIKVAASSIYSIESKNKVERAIREYRPDIVHVHNLFPRFSASIYDPCESAGVPVVQTLHNYRVTCAN